MEQHFLKNINKYKNLLNHNFLEVENVLEFGIGNGEITNLLLEYGYKVFGYEIDSGLSFPTHSNLHLKICDFLKEDFSFVEDMFKIGVISNPPYSCLPFLKSLVKKYHLPFILMVSSKYLDLFDNVMVIGSFSGADFEPASSGKHFLIKSLL